MRYAQLVKKSHRVNHSNVDEAAANAGVPFTQRRVRLLYNPI
jgi:hypothetical protein